MSTPGRNSADKKECLVAGPYESETDTYTAPMLREVRALHAAGKVPSGDPDHVVRNTVMGHLTAACGDVGIELGEFDRHALERLADSNDAAAQAVIGLIIRAHAAGRAVRA